MSKFFNIGKIRLQCFDCGVFHYGVERVEACAKCLRKREKNHLKWIKRYREVLLDNPTYFEEAEELAQEMAEGFCFRDPA